MQVPRFYTGLALLFWGWQTQMLWIAAALALIIESTVFFKTRFKFSISDINKFFDISILILAATLVIALTNDPYRASRILLKWLPVIFFPMMAAQQFSSAGKIDTRSFYLAGRKKRIPQYDPPRIVNIAFPYTTMVLFASAAANIDDYSFFIGIGLFGAWALWHCRSRRFSGLSWGAMMILVLISGFYFQQNIKSFGIQVSHWLMNRYADYYSANPFKSHTAMGDIGHLKFSDQIRLRVVYPDKPSDTPFLLHQATYVKFIQTTWFARAPFTEIDNPEGSTAWQIQPLPDTPEPLNQGPSSEMIIYSNPIRNKALLSLPAGVAKIRDLKAGILKTNAYTAVQAEDLPPLIKSRVLYTGQLDYDKPPDAADLSVSKKDKPVIQAFIDQAGLSDTTLPQTLNTLKAYFSNQFEYSLALKGKGRYSTTLENFLFHTRSGHCELFATAAALTLRQLNIPSRYATGYIAHESSPMTGQTLVRQRDAHAWVKVFVDGKWVNFDPTPASFIEIDETEIPSFWFKDWVSFIGFSYFRLRHETGKAFLEKYGLWLIVPLALILFFRLNKKSHIRRVEEKNAHENSDTPKPVHARFSALERELAQQGCGRFPHEPLFTWHHRVEKQIDAIGLSRPLLRIIRSYYVHCFSRNGLDQEALSMMESSITDFISHLKTRPLREK